MQGCKSKALFIYSVMIESNKMDVKLMEITFWNGTHAKHISLKKIDSKVKLEISHVNNMKNVEARCEAS